MSARHPVTVAESYLAMLREQGIEALHVNAGTDFAPIVEAYARGRFDYPDPIVLAHENLAVSMAHGAWLVSRAPQAVMLHVSVGTANAICAVMNAARDGVPLLITAGRTPILETGAIGARDAEIHWAQELFDQAGMVRELVKWDYELRDPRQLGAVLDRAMAVGSAPPAGPVYLSLPREVLAAPAVMDRGPPTGRSSEPAPDPAAVVVLADRLARARLPVLVTAAAGADERAVRPLADLCERFAIGVVEKSPRRLNIPFDHPNHFGDRGDVLAEADVVVVLDCDVPWTDAGGAPSPGAFVAHLGVDPLFARYPMRSHRSDLAIVGGTSNVVDALLDALEPRTVPAGRAAQIAQRARAGRPPRLGGDAGPIEKDWMSQVLGEVLDSDDIVFNEYWGKPDLLRRREPGTYFSLSPAGGLGWALPAALGARRAAPDRTVVATVGDGAYLFANPAACHHAARKHQLPVLTIVANNSRWRAVDEATARVYPAGSAAEAREGRLSDLSPLPAFDAYCQASGGHGERVEHRAQLIPALHRALSAVREEGRQALLNVECT